MGFFLKPFLSEAFQGLVWAEMGWAWWINPAGGGKERGGSIGLGLIESNPTVWPSSHNS